MWLNSSTPVAATRTRSAPRHAMPTEPSSASASRNPPPHRDAHAPPLRSAVGKPRRDTTIPDAGRQITLTPGLAKRFKTFLKDNPKAPGIKLLRDTWEYGIRKP